MRLCAYYLLHAKQDARTARPGGALPPRQRRALERLNWLGDTSESGMARSAGLMVNYVYRLDDVERNHERYFAEHAVVASRAVADAGAQVAARRARREARRGLSAVSRHRRGRRPATSWPKT